MAIANQIKALLKSHVDGDDAMFLSIAMQIAALEAKKGHGNLAKEIRDLIDSAKGSPKFTESKAIPLTRPRGELSQLLNVTYPQLRLVDMVLSENIQAKLDRLIKEHKHIQKLRAHGLSPRKKLLLVRPPGTGKTMTASVLAGELGLPLFIVRLESLMTKYMGETAGKLRLIFDAIEQTRGVYLFNDHPSYPGHGAKHRHRGRNKA